MSQAIHALKAAALAQTVQVTKAPAKKTAAKSVEKPAEKAEKVAKPKAVAFTPRKAKKGQVIYVIAEQARPQFGRALFAHTHAAMTILGLLDASRPSVPQASLLTLVGQRAVSWHKSQANLEETADRGLRLSSQGFNKFKGREIDGKIDAVKANEFVDLFLTGKLGENIGIKKANVYQSAF